MFNRQERGDRCWYDTGRSYSHVDLAKQWLPKAQWDFVPNFYVARKTYPEILLQDDLIKAVIEKYGNTYLNFYKIPANSTYYWHRDLGCKVCFNLVMDEYDSTTLFSYDMPLKPLGAIELTWTMKYKPNTWYIFDTQEKHMIVNNDDRDRILLTVRIPPPVTYNQVLDWYKSCYISV